LELTNSVHNFNNLLTSFIESKKIEGDKLVVIDTMIDTIEKYKADFVSS